MNDQTELERKIGELYEKYKKLFDFSTYPKETIPMFMEMARWTAEQLVPEKKGKVEGEDELWSAHYLGFDECRDQIISNAKSIGIELRHE